MNKSIEHKGIINNIRDGYVDVKIIQKSACAGCHAKSACSAADMAEKIIEVPYYGTDLNVGDEVTISGSESMGWMAVILAFIIPLLILLIALIVSSKVLNDELLGGIITLCTLVPYYIILYIFRNRMNNKFAFHIKGK